MSKEFQVPQFFDIETASDEEIRQKFPTAISMMSPDEFRTTFSNNSGLDWRQAEELAKYVSNVEIDDSEKK